MNSRPSSRAATRAAAELLQQKEGSTAPAALLPAMPSIDAGRANFLKTHPFTQGQPFREDDDLVKVNYALTATRQLSHRMLETCDKLNLSYLFTARGTPQLDSYTPVTRQTEYFNRIRTRPLISFVFLAEEMLLLDPRSDYLQKEYERLKKSLPASREPIDILRAVHHFVRQEFMSRKTDEETDKAIADIKKSHGVAVPTSPHTSVVAIEEILKRKLAQCRHMAFFIAYGCDFLKEEGILPAFCRVYHHQDTLPRGPHVWVICHDLLTDNLFIVDANLEVHDIRTQPYSAPYLDQYSQLVLNQCNQEYKSVGYELVLHQQHAKGISCARLRKDLDTFYHAHPHHALMLQTLAQIEKTSATLCTSVYTRLSFFEARKHFTLALLTQLEAKSDVQPILQQQGTIDLHCLRLDLQPELQPGIESDGNSYQLYQQVSSFNTLLTLIDAELETLTVLISRLDSIKHIIMTESTADNTSTGCCFFSRPWHEVKTEHGITMRIPIRIYPLYQLAFNVNTKNANVAELTKVLTDIRTAATSTRTTQTQYRNDNFFVALSDAEPEKKYGELTKKDNDAFRNYTG